MAAIIKRERYLRLLRKGRDLTDVVKVVTGMRRAGKSTLLLSYIDELKDAGVDENSIIYINLETFDYLDVRDSSALNTVLKRLIGDSEYKYVFLDEIQNVDGWEISVSALVNTGRCDVYITGSNSKMLSSELATHIAGRHVEIGVLPLSFSEYLQMHPGDRTHRFNDYLRFGALPEVDPARGREFCDIQLKGIYNTVLVDDIMSRMTKGNVNFLKSISRFLYSNVGNRTNVDEVAKWLGLNNVTVSKYTSMLNEAFLFYYAENYDIVGKKLLKTNGKFYASDLGLRSSSLMFPGYSDTGRLLENVVYLELLRRGYTVRVGSYKSQEIDFTASKGDVVEYFQVSASVVEDSTRSREARPLKCIEDNYQKVILTLDTIGLGSDEGIQIVNVIDWLLDDGL